MLLSTLMLVIGIPFINRMYKFNAAEWQNSTNDLTLMSYNVRLFDLYKWKGDGSLQDTIVQFFNNQNPDIICIQEYSKSDTALFAQYPYKHIVSFDKRERTGHAIYSKYRLLNKGQISFETKGSSIIYADVLYKTDTIRLYSMHLKSVNITREVTQIEDDLNQVTQERSKLMLKRMSESFALQQEHVEILKKHRETVKNPVIICGDLNNSAFSYVYRSVRGDLLDAFEEAGNGFGTSYDFKYYPARIDYIFADPTFEIKSFKSHSEFSFSDHFPIVARLQKVQE